MNIFTQKLVLRLKETQLEKHFIQMPKKVEKQEQNYNSRVNWGLQSAKLLN